MQIQEWQLQITETGEIFVQHFTLPRFVVEIIIMNEQPDLLVRFEMNSQHANQDDFYWHMKALEFYNNAPKPPVDS
jgi:tyrosine-protein phosphatase YwqE